MTMTSFHIQSHSYSCIDNQSYWSKLVAHLLPLQTFSKFQPKHCSFGTWTYIRFNERRTWWGTFANRILPFNYWLHNNSVVCSPLHIYHQTLHNSIGPGNGSLRARDFAFWNKKASTQNPIEDVLARSIEPLNDAPRGCWPGPDLGWLGALWWLVHWKLKPTNYTFIIQLESVLEYFLCKNIIVNDANPSWMGNK